jgi:hypothetical protein
MSIQHPDVADPVTALRAADPVMAGLIDGLDPVDLASWRARSTAASSSIGLAS